MRKLFAVLFAFIVVFGMVSVTAEVVEVPGGNRVRFDISEEKYQAVWSNFFSKLENDSDDLNHLNTYPVLPASMMKMMDEFRNNSSTLLNEPDYFQWHTEAAKVVVDERLLGTKAWIEYGSPEKKQDIDETQIDGQGGIVWFYPPEGYSFEDISALRILYESGFWMGGYWGNARFDLTYSVSGGKVSCDSLEVIMEYDAPCMMWSLERDRENGRLILWGSGENMATEQTWSMSFDAETGESLK